MNPNKRPNVRFFVHVFSIFLLVVLLFGQGHAQIEKVRQFQADIPMSDGIKLSTDIYLPESKGKFPAILIRTPYNSKQHKQTGEFFAGQDYAVVIQNVRGTTGSEGDFVPLVNEKSDGIETLKWVCKQEWNNSKVGFWGASYLAFSGLQIASGGDDCLAAGMNISGWSESGHFVYENGVFRLGDHLPWFVFSATGRALPAEQINKLFMTTPLMKALGQNVGLQQPTNDYDYEKVKIPILHMTGWFDYIYKDTLRTHNQLKQRSPKSDAQKLIIGHWAHNEIYQTTTKAGDEDFGPEASFGFRKLLALSIKWFDFHLKGIDNGTEKEPNIRYLVMGENRWREANQWAPKNVEFKKWYLQKNKDEKRSGALKTEVPTKSSSSTYLFDPNNPVPTAGGANSHFLPWLIGVKDQRFTEKRNDVLIFDSAPLNKAMILAGPVRAVIYASTEGKDTDFTAKLVEVRPDGYARIIESGIMRGRFIKANSPELLEPQKVYKFQIDLGATAVKLNKGSRIRLEVSSSNFPKYPRNPNTGEEALMAKDFKSVMQTVFHSTRSPSHVILPVLGEP